MINDFPVTFKSSQTLLRASIKPERGMLLKGSFQGFRSKKENKFVLQRNKQKKLHEIHHLSPIPHDFPLYINTKVKTWNFRNASLLL